MIELNGILSVLIVLALLGALVWFARRGMLGKLRGNGRPIVVETAVPIGERRSLVIVAVEGRRLLLGLTPGQVSLVTELQASGTFQQQLANATSEPR
jgi:flagellar protein FliO/FliZ